MFIGQIVIGQIVYRPDCLRARLSQGPIVQGPIVQGRIVWGPIVQGHIVPVPWGVLNELKGPKFEFGMQLTINPVVGCHVLQYSAHVATKRTGGGDGST